MFQAGSTYQKEQTNVYEVQAMLSMMDVNCAEGWIQDWPQTCGLLDQNWQKKQNLIQVYC